MAKIMIDPGHAPGCPNHGPTGYYEYAGTWKISNYLKAALERCGHIVGLSRGENNDPALSARGRCAAGYDVYISEHTNAGAAGRARGVEVYYSIRNPGDRQFAADLANAIAAAMGNNSRGPKIKESDTKGYDWLTVLFYAQRVCPHVFLCENGFHENAEDEAILKTESGLKAIAEAQAKVICSHLGCTYKSESVQPAPTKPVTPVAPKAPKFKADATYRVRTVKFGWLPPIINLTNYAGWKEDPITDVAIKMAPGDGWYQVHVLGGNWLPKVTGYNTADDANGYAGNHRPIDAIRVYYKTPVGIRPWLRAKYRVTTQGNDFTDNWQYDDETANGQQSFVGTFGKPITKFEMVIE